MNPVFAPRFPAPALTFVNVRGAELEEPGGEGWRHDGDGLH
jgi:predicted esterase